MTKKVLELIRVSTEGQAADDRASIPAQRTINQRTAKAHDLRIVRSIEIADVSGAAVLRSPEMQEMLRLIEDPEIHGVVAREFSRLMRPENFADYILLQAFADTRTLLYLPDGPIDFGSKSGRLLGTIRAAMAGMERAEILERVWAAKEEKRRAGKFAQGAICLPFGVGYTEAHGFFYTPDAERVRRAFQLFLSGQTGYAEVGQIVGIDRFSLRVILRNPVYTGWRVIDKRRDTSAKAQRYRENGRQGDRPKIPRAPEDIIRVKVIAEPLITQREFERVQQIIETKKRRHWRTRNDYAHRFVYNGFLTCGQCGQTVYTGFMRDDYYICKGKRLAHKCRTGYMRRDRLDPLIDDLFCSRLTDRGFLGTLVETIAIPQTPAPRLELSQFDNRRERILESFYDGTISKAERDTRLRKLDTERATMSRLMAEQIARPGIDADGLAEMFAPFFEWETLNRDQKRRILAAVVPEIKVADYRIYGVTVSIPECRNKSYPTDAAYFIAAPQTLYLALGV